MPQEIEKYCSLHGHPYMLARSGKMVRIYEPPEKLGRAIAYCIYDNHAFFYKSARTVSSWSVDLNSTPKSLMLH
jgi:hypothetical protein